MPASEYTLGLLCKNVVVIDVSAKTIFVFALFPCVRLKPLMTLSSLIESTRSVYVVLFIAAARALTSAAVFSKLHSKRQKSKFLPEKRKFFLNVLQKRQSVDDNVTHYFRRILIQCTQVCFREKWIFVLCVFFFKL